MAECCKLCREEFRKENFLLDHPNPGIFVKFQVRVHSFDRFFSAEELFFNFTCIASLVRFYLTRTSWSSGLFKIL